MYMIFLPKQNFASSVVSTPWILIKFVWLYCLAWLRLKLATTPFTYRREPVLLNESRFAAVTCFRACEKNFFIDTLGAWLIPAFILSSSQPVVVR